MASSTFIVFENLSGHRRSFLDFILQNQHESSGSCTVLILGQAGCGIQMEHYAECQVQIYPTRRSLLLDILRISEQREDSRFYFMDFDRWLLHFFFMRDIHFYGLVLRPYLNGKRPIELLRFLLKHLLLFGLDSKFPNRIFKLSIPMHKHCFQDGWVDELPVNFGNLAESSPVKLQNLANREHRFLVIGAISQRKRLDLAIDLVIKFTKKSSLPAILRVVGKHDQSSHGFLDVEGLKIQFLDSYLTDYEYQREIYETDFLIAFNSNIGSSRTILEGISSNKIVVTNRLSRHWKNFEKQFTHQLYEFSDFLEQVNAKNAESIISDFPEKPKNLASRTNWYEAMFNGANI